MLLEFQSAEEIAEEEAPPKQDDFAAYGDELAKYVRGCWEEAKMFRNRYSQRLQDCHRRRSGLYSAQQLEAIKENKSSEIYIRLTSSKCKAAQTWLADLFDPAGDRPFTLTPRHEPEMPPEIMQQMIEQAMEVLRQSQLPEQEAIALVKQYRGKMLDQLRREAENRAEKMEDKIEDMLCEGGWREEFNEFLDDIVTYPLAVMSSMEFRSEFDLKWGQGPAGFSPQYKEKVVPKWRRVSPFRFYPSPSIRNNLRGHWVIEHMTYTRLDLVSMRNSPGYNAKGIAMALSQYSYGGLREWIWNGDEREQIGYYSINIETIDALRWSGSISGKKLADFGLPGLQPFREYQATIEIVGDFVIRASISPDPDEKPSYQVACWSTVPGSLYGDALPELMSDCQDMCNAAARSVVDNMEFCSGPQVWVNQALMADGADVTNIYARKIWLANQEQQGTKPGIEFFQAQSNANELMAVFERFSNIADDVTGLPKFAYGSDSGAGAAKTMGGLEMLMNAASKSIKHVVRGIDLNIIEPQIKQAYNHEMYYGEDDEIKGDLLIVARGSQSLIHKEQMMMRQQQLLAMTNNPTDMSIIGLDGRLEQLNEVFKSGDIPPDRILPSREELMQKQQAQQAQQQIPQQMPQQ